MALEPHAYDIVIYRHRFSGFYQGELGAGLEEIGQQASLRRSLSRSYGRHLARAFAPRRATGPGCGLERRLVPARQSLKGKRLGARKSWPVSLRVVGLLAQLHAGVRTDEVGEKIDTRFIFAFPSGVNVRAGARRRSNMRRSSSRESAVAPTLGVRSAQGGVCSVRLELHK